MHPYQRPSKIIEQKKCERLAICANKNAIVIGDSIANCLKRWQFSWDILQKDFQTANYGIGGDRAEHILARSIEGQFPRNINYVAIIGGTNNLGKIDHTADMIAKTVINIGLIFKQKFHKTKIAIVSVLPRDQRSDSLSLQRKRHEVNRKLLSMCAENGFSYINTSCFEGDGCRIDKRMYIDGIHLNERGNVKLANMLHNTFVKQLKSSRLPPH